jgi:hypothetical protein
MLTSDPTLISIPEVVESRETRRLRRKQGARCRTPRRRRWVTALKEPIVGVARPPRLERGTLCLEVVSMHVSQGPSGCQILQFTNEFTFPPSGATRSENCASSPKCSPEPGFSLLSGTRSVRIHGNIGNVRPSPGELPACLWRGKVVSTGPCGHCRMWGQVAPKNISSG